MQDTLRYKNNLFLLMMLMTSLAFAGLNICRKCGYENNRGASVCTHCEANIPVPGKSAPMASDEDAGSDADYIPLSIIDAEIAEARNHAKNKQYELARLFLVNALAMEGVTDPADHGERSEKILKMIKSAETAARSVQKPCPRCSGSGKQKLKLEGLNSRSGGSTFGSGRKVSTDGFAGIKCKKCDGQGSVLAVGTIDDLRFAKGKAEAAYRKLQQTRKYEPLGGAWIPLELADTLNTRQKATLMRAIVLPCDTCAGFGRLDCRRCGGAGRLECGNSSCNKGRVPYERTERRIQRMEGNTTKKCGECGGRASLPCSSCDEEGSAICKGCDGSGDSEACSKCSARGYLVCNKCGGSTEYRGEQCVSCRGEGNILCTSCNGGGRRK